MSQHIGIVACSAEGAALCYRTICVEGAALYGAHAHPEVSMHTPSFADYMAPIYRDDWPRVAELMLASADKLKRAGADFLICPDNTIHQALPYVLPRSPLPWLHIAEVVAAEAVARDGPEVYVFRQNGDGFDRKPVRLLYEDRRSVVLANDGSVAPGQYVARAGAASLNRVLKAQTVSGSPGEQSPVTCESGEGAWNTSAGTVQ